MHSIEEPDCGFSCTLSKKKIYENLNNLVQFSEYDPVTAMEIAEEVLAQTIYARNLVYNNLVNASRKA